MAERDGKWLETAGLILVRQKPGSAKGVLLVTIENETGNANLVIWPDLFERQRRVVLASTMLGLKRRVQREGEVVHIIAHSLFDLSDLLRSVGDRDQPLHMKRTRGGQVKHEGGSDPRDRVGRPWNMYVPDLRLGSGIVPGRRTMGIRVTPRDFR